MQGVWKIMKKVSFLLAVVMLSLTFHAASVQAKLTEADEKFIQTITKDFIITHNINLNSYYFYDMREISPTEKESLTTEEKSLSDIFKGIAKEQYFMDCSPLFYIDGTNKRGYVLEKKLNGMNTLHLLTYDNTSRNWKVTTKVNKMGKDLVELGLLKGTE